MLNKAAGAVATLVKFHQQLASVQESHVFDVLEDHKDDAIAAVATHQRRLELVSELESAVKAAEKVV